jgi:type IV secretory pathway TrbD component
MGIYWQHGNVAGDEAAAKETKGDTMKANVGGVDRVIRIVAGLIIIVLGVVFKSWWGLIGLLPLATALINFCPLYTLIGISTRKAAPQ